MYYSKQKPTFGHLALAVVLSFVVTGQLMSANYNAAFAQTSGPTMTASCYVPVSSSGEESISNPQITVELTNLNPDTAYNYTIHLGDRRTLDFARINYSDEQLSSFTKVHTLSGSFPDGVFHISLIEDSTPRSLIEIEVTCEHSPPTPAQSIDELISDVDNLGDDVPQSVKTSLAAPLQQASNSLNDDNPNNDESACGKLDAFVNQVNANERRGDITEQQADDLRTQAEDIRSELDC